MATENHTSLNGYVDLVIDIIEIVFLWDIKRICSPISTKSKAKVYFKGLNSSCVTVFLFLKSTLFIDTGPASSRN